jgi:hypothetical protein
VFFGSSQVIENMERETGIEPATSSLGSWHSTAELLPLLFIDYLADPGLATPIPAIPSIQSIPYYLFGRQMDSKTDAQTFGTAGLRLIHFAHPVPFAARFNEITYPTGKDSRPRWSIIPRDSRHDSRSNLSPSGLVDGVEFKELKSSWLPRLKLPQRSRAPFKHPNSDAGLIVGEEFALSERCDILNKSDYPFQVEIPPYENLAGPVIGMPRIRQSQRSAQRPGAPSPFGFRCSSDRHR